MEYSVHDIRPVIGSLSREKIIRHYPPFGIPGYSDEEVKYPELSAYLKCIHVMLVHVAWASCK